MWVCMHHGAVIIATLYVYIVNQFSALFSASCKQDSNNRNAKWLYANFCKNGLIVHTLELVQSQAMNNGLCIAGSYTTTYE